MFPKILWTVLVVSIVCHAPWVYALRSDRDQPIHIEADRVNIDDKREVSHYQGNVHMTQGTMKIDADEVFVHLRDGALHKVIIIGKPAHFQQQTERSGGPIKSQANRMEYFAGNEKLLLRDDAVVIQDGNRFTGDYIEYDTRASVVKANKEQDSGARVHAIIQPKTETEKPAQGNAPQP
jgi:lipopolysaccharide export system protein LptA